MRICFDYQIFWLQRQGGISRYFCELAEHLSQINNNDPFIAAPFHENRHLLAIKNPDIVQPLSRLHRKFYYNRFWDKRKAVNEKAGRVAAKNSILHETYYTHRFPVRAKRVTTVHDMIYEKFYSGRAGEQEIIDAKKKAVLESDAVIAVSQSTKNDLLDIYPQIKDKVSVVYHGASTLPNSRENAAIPAEPFILFVGNRGWYKNFNELMEVFGSEPSLHKNFLLVCFGGEDEVQAEQEKIRKFGLVKKVRFLRGDDTLLGALYAAASVLVYNSKYEGFGMPVLEAMAAGCPVICSDTSSLPEVGGEAVVYVSPGNTLQLLDALRKVLGEKTVAERLRVAGLKRAGTFSWERCAMETLEVYKKVLHG